MKLIPEQECVIDITPMNEDNIVLLDAEHQLGCNEEIHDILVDFYNMGILNTQCASEDIQAFIPEGIVEEDIMYLLLQLGFADAVFLIRPNDGLVKAYFPTMLFGIQGRELCQAVAQVTNINA